MKYNLTRRSAAYINTTAEVQEKNASSCESTKPVHNIRTQDANKKRLNNPENIEETARSLVFYLFRFTKYSLSCLNDIQIRSNSPASNWLSNLGSVYLII